MGSKQQSFSKLFHQMAIADNETQLRSYFMDAGGELFEAKAWGINFFDENFQVSEFDLQGLPETIFDRYYEIGSQADPIIHLVHERHIPAHNLSVFAPQTWKQSLLYQHICLRHELEHILYAPLIARGQLIGKIYFMQEKGNLPFINEDLSNASALCLHLSVCLATMRSRVSELEFAWASHLTKRELYIADYPSCATVKVDRGDRES